MVRRDSGVRVLLAMGIVVLLVAACGSAGGSPEPTTLTAAANGTTVQATVGENIFIALEANPTTGYRWQVQPGLDPSVVTFVGDDYQQGPSASGTVGAGGTDTLEFLAAGKGTTTIALTYAQVGSGDVGSTFSVKVEVR